MKTDFNLGLVSSSIYFSVKKAETKKIAKNNRLHNLATGFGNLPLIGIVASILGAVQMCKLTPKDERAFKAGVIVGYSIRATISTFTGPFILPFIDLGINSSVKI